MIKERKLAYLALLTTSVIWGLAPPIIKYTLGFVSPVAFLFYRFLLVSLILLIPLTLRLVKNRPTRRQLLDYLFLGFLATPLNLILLFEGLKRTSATDASVISVISPILVVAGGAFFLKEKVERRERAGIVITLAGSLLTVFQPILENGLGSPQNLWGNFLVLFGVGIWATFTLGAKKHKDLDPFILTSISFLLGAVLFFPLFLLNEPAVPPPFSLPGILFMSVFGSLIAYFTYVWGLSKIEASEATIFTYLQPLFAVPLAALWLKEPLTPAFLAGALLIGLGVFVCEYRPGPAKPILKPNRR